MTISSLQSIQAESLPRKKTSFRLDIQGLRAVAVLVVIADHLFGWPMGGFVGVDVFFVVSGYLITALLLREYERTGKISFVTFYKRRIARLLPVSVLTIVLTVIAASLIFNSGRSSQTLVDGIWAFFFLANWRFLISGTDYFQADVPISPLQHFWSLAVEEQFYFVWPWLMLLVLAISVKFVASRASQRTILGAFLGLITIVLFCWSLWQTANYPTSAYFSTVSRAWELGIGGVLAVFAPVVGKISLRLRPLLSWAGLSVIMVSVFMISDSLRFPGPWALLPVLGTALVIAAGEDCVRVPTMVPLTNPVSQLIGNMSYSLYLWHFPIIIIAAALMPPSPLYYMLMLVGIFGISAASYYFVESPLRVWLFATEVKKHELRETRLRKKHLRQDWIQSSASLPAKIGFTFVSVVVAAGLVFAALIDPLPATSEAAAPVKIETKNQQEDAKPSSEDPVDIEQARIGKKLTGAMRATEWPNLTPAIEDLPNNFASEWLEDRCLNVTDSNLTKCLYGNKNASKLAVVLGDSFAASWMPAIRGALEPSGWRIQMLTYGECPAIAIEVIRKSDGERFAEKCSEHQQWAQQKVGELDPDLIIMGNAENSLGRLKSGAEGTTALQEWGNASGDTLGALRARSKAKIVTLTSPPGGKSLASCATNLNQPNDCVSEVKSSYRQLVDTEAQAAELVSGAFTISPEPWLCVNGRCPTFSGDVPIYVDNGHLTRQYSALLSTVLGLRLEKILTAE